MAEIIQNEGGGKKKGKQRAKKHSTHVDMTPMVDLACLLLTFFMLTTAFSKPKVMEILMPQKKGGGTEFIKSRTLHIIMDENDKIYWYNGLANPLEPPLPELHQTDFSKDGIRRILLQRNRDLFSEIEKFNEDITKGKIIMPADSAKKRIKEMKSQDQTGPLVLIKATDKVKYGNVVNIVDEMAITNVAVYAIVDMNKVEQKMLADYKTAHGIK